jgi:hypothetical protein
LETNKQKSGKNNKKKKKKKKKKLQEERIDYPQSTLVPNGRLGVVSATPLAPWGGQATPWCPRGGNVIFVFFFFKIYIYFLKKIN